MKAKVLLVEDDAAVRRLTADLLHAENYEVKAVATVEEGWNHAEQWRPDLAVLDLNFPVGNGLDLCRQLKENGATRDCLVLMLTARGGTVNVVEGLKVGADDYLAKPFHEQEFLARVAALLRRRGAFVEPVLELMDGSLRLSRKEHRAWLDGKELKLTLREFEVIVALVSAPGQALTREQIIERAWGPGMAVVSKAVDVHVNHLRKKFGKHGMRIQAVPQVGFRWNV
ncbi:MAG: response regulator transcription factor [bacterium]